MLVNFSRMMSAMAARYRDNVAMVNLERNRRYTFPEYHRLTNRIANMTQGALGLGKGDTALLILDNDSLGLVHFPAIFKQPATFAFSNMRDSKEEHLWQIEYLRPKVVFIETQMLAAYHDMLTSHGCTIVVMDHAGDLPQGVHCFWDLAEAASDADNDVELDDRDHISILRFTGGTTGRGKCAMYAMDQIFACRDSAYIQPDFDYDENTRYLALTPLSHLSIFGFLPVILHRRRHLHAECARPAHVVRDRAARKDHARAAGSHAALPAVGHEQYETIRPFVAAHPGLRRGPDRSGCGRTADHGVRSDLCPRLWCIGSPDVCVGAQQA
jgi:acyl-coenzyme A synthetase/AMP-(fatty) acid ligase